MTEVKASVKNLRSTPRKARLIADFIRGKEVSKALIDLKFLNKKAAKYFIDLLKSAIANAENNNSLKKQDLFIKSVQVDEGAKLKRYRAGSNGKALPFKRRLSNVSLTLEDIKINNKK